MRTTSRSLWWVAAITGTLALAGCSGTFPADPDGTLQSVEGGELRVGISPNGRLVQVDADEPTGEEVEAIRAFAAELDADVEWTVGSEETLVRGLEDGRLDLVAGGITDDTPWTDKAGATRAYREISDAEGRPLELVMLVPLGENAFLSELETFLSAYVRNEARP